MKVTYYAFAVYVCLLAFASILSLWGISPIVMTPFNVNTTSEAYDPSDLIDSIDPTEKEFYDIGSGLQHLWNKNIPIIESAFSIFAALGLSDDFISIILLVWRFFWVGFIISFISGRDFMP
jgi:hypothetical protein